MCVQGLLCSLHLFAKRESVKSAKESAIIRSHHQKTLLVLMSPGPPLSLSLVHSSCLLTVFVHLDFFIFAVQLGSRSEGK
jgi:hypothetical protein